MSLTIGDKAPDFTLHSDQNEQVSLKSLRGKNVILYFYPRDNTPGCTRQACDFRDHIADFSAQNIEVIGISKDNVQRHQKFKEKFMLPFTLLADEEGDVCQAYGVIDKKSMFGNTFLGIQRSTFLIDENGIIQGIWRKVKATGHIKQLLKELDKA